MISIPSCLSVVFSASVYSLRLFLFFSLSLSLVHFHLVHLDLDRIKKTRRTADKGPTREGELGKGIEPTLVQYTCTIRNTVAALKMS